MKSFKLKKALVSLTMFLIFGFFAFYSQNVLAGNIWDAQMGSGNQGLAEAYGQTGNPNLKGVVYNIINVALTLLAILFVGLVIAAGFLWMTAAGDSKKVETAQSYLKDAIIGLIIILAAKGVTIFLINNMVNATNKVNIY